MIVGCGAVAAVVVPLYLFVFVPKVQTLAMMSRQVQVKTRELAGVEAIAGRLPAVERQRADIDTRLRAMEQQMPTHIRISEVVGRLSKAIDASGVQLVEVTFPAGTQPSAQGADPVEEVPFTLKIRGTFATVIALMQHLEAPPRLIVGQALGISGGPPLLEITMDMKAFALR